MDPGRVVRSLLRPAARMPTNRCAARPAPARARCGPARVRQGGVLSRVCISAASRGAQRCRARPVCARAMRSGAAAGRAVTAEPSPRCAQRGPRRGVHSLVHCCACWHGVVRPSASSGARAAHSEGHRKAAPMHARLLISGGAGLRARPAPARLPASVCRQRRGAAVGRCCSTRWTPATARARGWPHRPPSRAAPRPSWPPRCFASWSRAAGCRCGRHAQELGLHHQWLLQAASVSATLQCRSPVHRACKHVGGAAGLGYICWVLCLPCRRMPQESPHPCSPGGMWCAGARRRPRAVCGRAGHVPGRPGGPGIPGARRDCRDQGRQPLARRRRRGWLACGDQV